jgi:hypothetical protein
MSANLTLTGPHTQIADNIFGAIFDHSLDFRIELPYEVALRFIERIGMYNEFEAATVLDALARVDRLIPRSAFGAGNPNNGNRDYKIEVGREGSPVIYLQRFEWITEYPLTEDQMKAACLEMQLCGKADEATYEITNCGGHARRITFRFWWD